MYIKDSYIVTVPILLLILMYYKTYLKRWFFILSIQKKNLVNFDTLLVGSLALEFQCWTWNTHIGIPMLDIGIPMLEFQCPM